MPAFARTLPPLFSKRLSKSATKRLPLSPKKVAKGYYKGKGGTTEGRHKRDRYVIIPELRLELIVPDLTGFKLKPYIAASVPKTSSSVATGLELPSPS